MFSLLMTFLLRILGLSFLFWTLLFHFFWFRIALIFILFINILTKLLVVDDVHKLLFGDVLVFAKNQKVYELNRNKSSQTFSLIITKLECSFCDIKVIFKRFWCLELSNKLFNFFFIFFQWLFVSFVQLFNINFKFLS